MVFPFELTPPRKRGRRKIFCRYSVYMLIEKLKERLEREKNPHAAVVVPVLEDLQDEIEQWSSYQPKGCYRSQFAGHHGLPKPPGRESI